MRLFYLFVFSIVSYSTVLCAPTEAQFDGNKLFESWSGDKQDFALTSNSLQLKATGDQKISYLSSPSFVIDDAEWLCKLRLKFNPSGSNYVRLYLTSDSPNLNGSLNGYFVQVGNASDQILLYRQTGTSVRKVAASESQRVDYDSVAITLRVNRSAAGEWIVASKVNDESDFSIDCTAIDTTFQSCYFFGIFCRYSSTRKESFFFDYVSAKGEEFVDETAPFVKSTSQSDTCLVLEFSERMNTKQTSFRLNEMNILGKWDVSGQKLTFLFNEPLQEGTIYRLQLKGLKDMAGNQIKEPYSEILLDGKLEWNDVIINEVLFHPFEGGEDYVELYNRSDKYIDLSNLLLATYKSDSIIYAAKKLPKRIIAPQEYVVVTSNQEAVCQFYNCMEDSCFVIIEKLPTYGNSKGNVVLINKDSLVIDELRYQESMHNELLKSKEGVSLERLSPDSNDWTSASETAGFGTPGYKNSTSANDLEEITLSNDVCHPHLSPEGDVVLTYSLTQPNYLANAYVFNLNGICVRHLAQNQMLGTCGEIVWDGKNDNGTLQPVAPYILIFEAHNAQGDVIKRKFVCIVGNAF